MEISKTFLYLCCIINLEKMKKTFKTTLLGNNNIIYFGDNEDRINILHIDLKWSVDLNFRKNGLVEPPVFNLIDLEMEYSETVSIFDDASGWIHESGDSKTEGFNLEHYSVEFQFNEIEVNGFVINQIEFDTKLKTIIIY